MPGVHRLYSHVPTDPAQKERRLPEAALCQ